MAQNKHGNDRGVITVLVTRFSAIGDVAMTVPVLYSACRCYPDVRFIMVTRAPMVQIFVDPPANLTVEGVDLKSDYAGTFGAMRLARHLIGTHHPDIVIDLHDVLRTKLIRMVARLHGIPTVHINKGRSRKRALTRRHNKVMLPLVSQRARYRQAFFKAHLPLTSKFAGLYPGHAKADPTLFSAIPSMPAGVTRLIGIAPFAAHKGKIYPPELMEQVIARLITDETTGIYLFGGGDQEQITLDGWAAKYPRIISLAGKKYGLAAEMALINHLLVMLTMDSANMHLASIAGTRTVSIWGATHPYCGFKGWRQLDDDNMQLPLTCRPCSVFGNKPCHRGDYLCLSGLRPETIYNKIIEITGAQAPADPT